MAPLLLGAALVVLALIAISWIHAANTRELLETTQRVEHTWEVTAELEETLSGLKDAETGQRGYLLTGETEYLEPYKSAVDAVPRHLDRLQVLVADNAEEHKRLAELRELIGAKLGELALTVRLSASGDTRAAQRAVSSGIGKELMDRIRQAADAMRTHERVLLAHRSEKARRAARNLTTASVVGAGAFVVLLCAFLALVRRDYVGRAAAESEARDSEEQLRTTLRSIGDGVLATDAEGRVTFLNPIAERLTGWSTADALGRPVEEAFRIVNEESRSPVESPVRRVIREGVVAGLANHTILIARDGKDTPIADSAAPVRDARGNVSGVVLVFRDITEQREAERATQRLAAIAASTEYAIVGETLENVITDWNPGAESLLGYTAAEMLGRRMVELGPSDDPNLSALLTRDILAGRRVGEFDARRRAKDGRWLDVAVSLYPIRASDGTVIGISRLMRDVTERRKHEAELNAARQRAEEANAAKDRFLATLSHELRTPLTPVMASVHRLERRSDLGPGLAESLAMIRRNVELEARLIDDLLDLTRIARGKVTLERLPLDLNEVLASVVQSSQSEFSARNISLVLRLDAKDHFVFGDAARLQQIFWNLLKNAAKFTPANGRVSVTSDNPSGGRVRIEVRDNGQGIRAELLTRLFEPFEQGDTTQTRRGGGLGLGLAIARNLVELHDGAISASSEGEGHGAVFAVDLPTTAEQPQPPSAAHLREGPVAAVRSRTSVLLVEDDVDSGEALRGLLIEAGFDVRVADRAAVATALFRERPADILVTDIGLPDASGLSLLASLKAMNPSLRAIVLSGYGMEEDVQRSRALGFAEHLVKPLNLNRLVAALDRLSTPA